MSSTPDYAQYTLAQLEEVEHHINRVKLPERHAQIVAEIERRHSLIRSEASEPLNIARVARGRERRNTVRRVIAYYEIFGGALAIVMILAMLAGVGSSIYPLPVLLVSLATAAIMVWGGIVLRRGKMWGVLLSIVAQLMGIPYYVASGTIRTVVSPFTYLLRFGVAGRVEHGVNMVALVAAIALVWIARDLKRDARE